jgi:protein PsiE
MSLNPPPDNMVKRIVLTSLEYIEWTGLFIITIATLIAIGQEVHVIFSNREVRLEDILLLFIFLEILTMVSLYFSTGKLPLRYPIYIAIVAIARYITISMKEMDGLTILLLSLAVFILSLAVLSIRYGHLYLAYGDKE